jgi:hypothetical protein
MHVLAESVLMKMVKFISDKSRILSYGIIHFSYPLFLYVFFYSMNCTFMLENFHMMIPSEIYRLLEFIFIINHKEGKLTKLIIIKG